MLQDKTYSNVKYYFQRQSNIDKFNELATVLQQAGVYNWDQSLQDKTEQDLIDMGIEEKYAHVFVSEAKRGQQLPRTNKNSGSYEQRDNTTYSSNIGKSENKNNYGNSNISSNSNNNNANNFYNYNYNDVSDFSDIASMVSYNSAHGRQRDSKLQQQYYTDEKIEREMSKIYEVWQEVNEEFFNQFPDLTRVIFLNFVAQEKMLIYGSTNASNVEELFRAFSKYIDYKKRHHFITLNTTVEELFEKPLNQSNVSAVDANFLLLHQIFQASSPLINAILHHLQEAERLTAYATTDQDQPGTQQFDSQILEEFLFTYFEDPQIQRPDEKRDNFDEFVSAMWTKNGTTGKIANPQQFLKNTLDTSKPGQNISRVPNAFRKPELKLTCEFLTALGDLAFEKVEDSTGILKIYLKELRERLLENKILISQRRWVRIFRVLKLIAFTRGIGDTTRVSLADCFITPFLVAKNRNEFEFIDGINLEVIESLARFYGSLKLSHYIEKHFWLLSSHKNFIKKIKRRHSHLPSFFQGCISHPEYFTISAEILQQQRYSQLCYTVSGSDRKILSDDFFAIDVNKAYEMKLDIKTSHKMVAYIGLVCFDENKEFIHSTQVCRIDNSEVLLVGDDPDERTLLIAPDSAEALARWNKFDPSAKDNQQNFAYLRSLGFYFDGDVSNLIPSSAVIQDTSKPYDTTENHGAYSNAVGGKIKLTEFGWKKYAAMKEKGFIEFNKTYLMNHFEGGTYTFAECFDDHIKKWMQKSFWFKGETRAAETNKFRKGTKFIKIVLLSNYNSGFPDFKILYKDASIMWKNIEFNYLK